MSGIRWILLFIVVNLLFWQKGNPNPGSRLATLAAMSQHHSFRIDSYVSGPLGWTNDWSRGPDGHFYSNKAPGPMLIGFPVFWIVDHMVTRHSHSDDDRQRAERQALPLLNLVLSVIFQVIPFAVLAAFALIRLREEGVSHAGIQVTAAAMVFGHTAALLMNTYFGHAMAAMFLLACVLSWHRHHYAWASFFISWAALCDYGVLVTFPVFIALILWHASQRFSVARDLCVGSALPLGLWCFYHTLCFGRPWRLALAYQSPEFMDLSHTTGAVWGIAHRWPQPGVGLSLLFSPSRGLLFTQPWTMVVLAMLISALVFRKEKRLWNAPVSFITLGFLALLAMNMSFGEWHGGATIGPRYLSAFCPLLALALGLAWSRCSTVGKTLLLVTVAISLVYAALVFSTTLFVPPGDPLWSTLWHWRAHEAWNGRAARFEILLLAFAWASVARPSGLVSKVRRDTNTLTPVTRSLPLFSLIIPTYNEAENIIPAVETAHQALGERPHEILVIDDASPDGTSERAQEYASRHPWLRVVNRHHERGLSGAVLEGIRHSRGAWIGVMDADRSHDEAILPVLVQALENGAEMAVGSRRLPGGGADRWPWYRRLTSDVATKMALLFLDIPLSDPMSGYFVIQRAVYERCHTRLQREGYKIMLELFCLGQPRAVEEVAFIFRDRRQGHSKLSHHVMRHYLRSLWRLHQYMQE